MANPSTAFDYDAHGLHRPVHRPAIPGSGPQTTAAVLDRMLAEDPDRPALIGRSGRFSYGELDAVVNRAAAVFAELGVGPGDRVAVCLGNDVDIVITLLASQRLGALWVGVNRPLAAPEKTYVLNDCGARVFLALPEFVEQIETNRSELSELEHVVIVDPEAGADAPNSWAARLDAMSSAERPSIEIDPFAPAAVAYTSGTTGFPKGAVHSQHNLLMPGSVAVATQRYGGLSQGVVLPLTILNLQVLGPLTAFQDGAACIAIDRIDPEGLAEWIREERIGNVCGVPTVLHDLLTHPDVKPDDLASLVCPEVGGAECPEEFRTLYKERFGQGVSIGYGMTEAPTAVTWSDPDASPRPGLCGKPLAHLEIRICGEDETPLEVGETGEICVAPASSGEWKDIYTPMLGYWNNPEETAKALWGGIYRSGDLGFVAEDGNLYISGRRNELILRGGANVYPAEVERILQEDPRVAGCAVLGIEDERLGERVVAAVELEPGQQASADELVGHCREQLARYKVPEQLVFVETLPRNAMSKVVKRELRPLFE
jgi:acyl-CoA synthetase (AMP-forming)/AMP-acid ligase II